MGRRVDDDATFHLSKSSETRPATLGAELVYGVAFAAAEAEA